MTAVVIIAEFRLADEPDPTMIAGPIGIAFATVVAYRALDREARARQQLVDELTAQPDELRVDVRDDGVGFDIRPSARRERLRQRRASGRGRGIAGIEERIIALGGTVEIESAPGEGTTLSAVFPASVLAAGSDSSVFGEEDMR
ncbi:ATP-binding protein [Microbacterium sp. GXF0217]